MGASTLRSLCYLFVVFVVKNGLTQALVENIQLIDLGQYPGTQFSCNSPAPQLINTLHATGNTNEVLPELLPAARPMWPQRENVVPFQDVVVYPLPEENFLHTNPHPTINIPPKLVLQPSFKIYPNVFPTASSNFKFPSIQVNPSLNAPTPIRTFPISQTFSPEIHNDDECPYNFLTHEDFFDNAYGVNDQLDTNIHHGYDVNVNEVNIHSTVSNAIPETVDASDTVVKLQTDVREIEFASTVNQAPVPYKIEINLPALASSPNASPQQVPFSSYGGYPPMPPIIIQGSSKSSMKNLLPLILISMLDIGGNDGGGCDNCRTVPVPYPIPIPTYNPIINGAPTKGRKKSNDVEKNVEDVTGECN